MSKVIKGNGGFTVACVNLVVEKKAQCMEKCLSWLKFDDTSSCSNNKHYLQFNPVHICLHVICVNCKLHLFFQSI